MVERVEFRTERLLLRPYRFDDVEDEFAYRSDPEFARYLYHLPQPFTRRDAEQIVAVNFSEPWEKYQTFAVVLDGRVIGAVNLELDADNQISMLGYAIGRDYWGRGIAPEASRALIDWGFRTFNLAKIWASTDARHERSWRVMEKLGMRREGVLRSEGLGPDGRHDSVHYGLLREEWEASQNRSV